MTLYISPCNVTFSISSAYTHIEKMEKFSYRQQDWTYKITEDITVLKSPVCYFSNPPTYKYKVMETGETFTGHTGDAREDYMLWKACERRRTCQISESISVVKSIMNNLATTSTFMYTVKETGEAFTGHTGDPKQDYILWKEDQGRRTYRTDGLTVVKSPVHFGNPPMFTYEVKETGESFTGYTGDAKDDYILWKTSRKEEPMDTSQ